jgi:Big-like domain-containing protein/papain like protease
MLHSRLSPRHRGLAASVLAASAVVALAALAACGGDPSSDTRGTHSADTTDGLHPLGYAYIASQHSALSGNVVPGMNPPPAADVSQFAPPVGDQGQIGDCTTWAVGYGLSSWLANSAGLNGGKNAFAPMFIFTHFAPAGSTDFGISTRDALDYLISSGIDTAADYDQNMPKTFSTTPGASIPGLGIDAASNDSQDPPTAQVLQNAQGFKIGGYQLVFDTPPQSNPGVCPGYPGGSLPAKAAIASGSPVVVALPVPPEFDNYDGVHPVQPPTATETSRGGHAIMCTKYDANGLWCQNSWGTSWGAAGMVQLSWAFVESCVWEIDTALGIGGSQSSTQLAVSITSPTNGQTVNGTVAVVILATPGAAPLSGVTVQVGGAPLGNASDSGESFSYSLDTTQLQNGQQPLAATVTDQQGNTATDTVTIDVEN